MRPRVALVFLALGLANFVDASAAALSGAPDPAQVCDGSGLAQMTIAWNAADSNPVQVEVHVGTATGQLFAAGIAVGSAITGKWVSNGTTFFLVDSADKKVLAQYTARLTTNGCPAPEPKKSFWRRLFGK